MCANHEECVTALGFPVVPDVYDKMAKSSLEVFQYLTHHFETLFHLQY